MSEVAPVRIVASGLASHRPHQPWVPPADRDPPAAHSPPRGLPGAGACPDAYFSFPSRSPANRPGLSSRLPATMLRDNLTDQEGQP